MLKLLLWSYEQLLWLGVHFWVILLFSATVIKKRNHVRMWHQVINILLLSLTIETEENCSLEDGLTLGGCLGNRKAWLCEQRFDIFSSGAVLSLRKMIPSCAGVVEAPPCSCAPLWQRLMPWDHKGWMNSATAELTPRTLHQLLMLISRHKNRSERAPVLALHSMGRRNSRVKSHGEI